ncbi:histidine kinase [Brachybacterium phenoliresistens]|uniref:histidine kinase n=1 Tax=Brachybacterium phenoliresistens TaxID=396014 RepID=Z9JSA5_9MICO|nr:sensor histidine kinase [Brachybacterium phenoliresistens]EWS81059.1 histidine kinase [Brachybacterium phenoliresistens]
MTTMPALISSPVPAPRRGVLARAASTIGRSLGYTLLSLVLAIPAFALVISLLSLGVGTAILWIGLPILVLAVLVARGFAAAGRRLITSVLGRPLPVPAPKLPPEGAGRVRRMLTPLSDPQRWLDVLWVLVQFVLVLVTFPVMVAWTIGAIGTLGGPLATLVLRRVLPEDQVDGLGSLLGLSGQGALVADLALQAGAGLVFLLTLYPVALLVRTLHAEVGRALLSSRFEEQQQLVHVQASRAAARTAESESLRRLERDLHDGPQQGLVRAGMALARAERLAAEDPERAREIVRETRELLGGTLDEVRRLSRGIAPPVLVDRGLRAALAELAGTSPVPATVRVEADQLPAHVETGIYYVVSESLANAAKHSRAGAVEVSVARLQDTVRVRVQDDGIGGARVQAGHGLAGLAGRVASLEGILEVSSPAGQGTRIEAVIPCGS